MRLTIGLLALLLGGCQGLLFADGPSVEASLPVMRLWSQYQKCRTASDAVDLRRLVEQLDRPVLVGSEPPAWLVHWGHHVSKPPLRLAVDPQALGVACTLRAAQVLGETDHVAEARDLYQSVLTRYSGLEWAYYLQEARDGLARLSVSPPALVVRRAAVSASP